MRKTNFLIIAISFMFFGCEKSENCLKFISGTNYSLSSQSLEYFNNYDKNTKVVYREINSNEELVFDIKKFNPLEVEYSKGVNCPYDSLQVSTLKGVSEMIVVELVNIDVWNKKIRLRITELPLEPSDNRNQEELLIQFGDINNQSIHSAENLLIHYTKENQPFTNIVDSIFIAGKMFYNVIETNGSNSGFSEPFDPPLIIKYTKSEGIIYIKDNVHNKEYVYDRVE